MMLRLAILTQLLAPAALARQDAQESIPAPPLTAIGAIELPSVEGRIDHLAVDLVRKRLFVAALENDSVEIVDLEARKLLKSIRGIEGLGEPQGILYLADCDRIVVANGESGMCLVLDGETFEPAARIDVGADADNLRYDAKHKLVYVAYASGALAVIDAQRWVITDRIKLTGHPEGFQLDAEGLHVWVNLPEVKRVTLFDLAHQGVEKSSLVEEAQQNYPLCLVEDGGRVLLGCRSPARLLVRSRTCESMQALELSGDVDDVFYDSARRRAYAICGEGSIDVFERDQPGSFRPGAKVATAPGARTGLYVPERNELFVAVPHRGEQHAEVRIYRAAD